MGGGLGLGLLIVGAFSSLMVLRFKADSSLQAGVPEAQVLPAPE